MRAVRIATKTKKQKKLFIMQKDRSGFLFTKNTFYYQNQCLNDYGKQHSGLFFRKATINLLCIFEINC